MMKLLLALALTLFATPIKSAVIAAQAFTLTATNGEEITLPREHHSVDIYFFWAPGVPTARH
jgi:hypothetical protein